MNGQRIRSRDAFYGLVADHGPRRRAFEALLATEGRGRTTWTHIGYCEPCATAVRFRLDWSYSDGTTPNYREVLECPRCLLNNRQRFAAAYVDSFLRETSPDRRASVYLYEQVTPFFQYVHDKWGRSIDLVGSEYLGHQYAPGSLTNGIRHEDATALSLGSESVDLIVSCDVYEHVPDYVLAFREAARVLRPGGRVFASIPFYPQLERTVERCRLIDGRLEHLLEPAYHGNPVDPSGALVFSDFGWDFLDRVRSEAGFADASMLTYYGSMEGYIGGGIQFVFEMIR